jgi:hypothetical protein
LDRNPGSEHILDIVGFGRSHLVVGCNLDCYIPDFDHKLGFSCNLNFDCKLNFDCSLGFNHNRTLGFSCKPGFDHIRVVDRRIRSLD